MTAVGRNEPCPCGSGRKYKRCCLERDEAREREQRAAEAERKRALFEPAPDSEVEAALIRTHEVMASSDDDRMSQLLDRFAELVEDSPLFGDLRFDDQAFVEAVERALPGIGRAKGERAADRLLEGALPLLADRRTVRRLRDQILHALGSATLASPDRDAVATGLICIEAVVEREMPSTASPTLEIVFNVQLDEWSEREDAMALRIDEISRRIRSGDIDLVGLDGAISEATQDDPVVMKSLVERTGVSRSMERSLESVERALRGRKAPPLFTAAEIIFLACEVRRELEALVDARTAPAPATEAPAKTLVRALERAFDDALANEIGTRIVADQRAAAYPDSQRSFVQSFLAALLAAPPAIGAMAFLSTLGRAHVRNAEEQAHVDRLASLDRWTAADLEAYRGYLERTGDRVGARLLERAARALPPLGMRGGLLAPGRRRRPRGRAAADPAPARDQLDLFEEGAKPPVRP